jgi:hypothetical protein
MMVDSDRRALDCGTPLAGYQFILPGGYPLRGDTSGG